MHTRFALSTIVIGIFLFIFIGCSSSPRYKRGRRFTRPSSPRVKKSTIVSGKQALKGIASYYGPGFHGKKTASGERFNMNDLTAAHKTLPFNTSVRVTNLENNKSVIVRINDRGPYKKGRIIDLSIAAAKKIGLTETGTAKVKLKILP